MAPPRVVKTDGGRMVLTEEERDVLAGVPASLEEIDAGTEEALIEHAAGASALLVVKEPITARVLDHLTECRVVTRFGVGLDTVDVAAATERGIRVTNVPDANFKEVSAHALAVILSLVRRIPQFDAAARRGDWNLAVSGEIRRLEDLVLGVIGVGRIGGSVATGARALGFTVLGFDPHLPDETIRERGAKPVRLDELVSASDIVTLHVPLTEETRGILSRERLAQMRHGAILVNASRGGLVDEDALVAALLDGRLGGAALDAYEHEPLPLDSALLSAPNAILTPHVAHYSVASRRELAWKAIADVASVLRGETPRYPVN
jgi:phosphoglycerate dehydrogenase-like enzyme